MIRKEKLEEIGDMKLDDYSLKVIIPIAHKFYKNSDSAFDTIKDLDWSILNKNNQALHTFGAYNIKKYICENVIPQFDDTKANCFLDNLNSLILRKELNKNIILQNKNLEYIIKIENIDLWIFEEHIGFFVLNIKQTKNYTVDDFSNIHNIIRNFKFLEVKENNNNIYFINKGYQETTDIITYLLNFTNKKNNSFLNITIDELMINNNLQTIYNSSTNAKLLIGMQFQKDKFSNGSNIEEDDEIIDFYTINETSILEEVSFYISSCLRLNIDNKSFIPDITYISSILEENSLSIWKYSKGLALHDSCAFIGIRDDGGPIVENTDEIFYFIYILNLYISFQIKFIEKSIINKDFEARDINYYYRKLQNLKNQFISNEIAIKFQENEVHHIISKSLKISTLLSEVTENLLETKEITQNNLGIYITLISFMFVSILQKPLENFFIQNFNILLPIIVFLISIVYYYRNKIRNYFKI